MLDVLIVFANFKVGFVIDDDFDLGGVAAILLALCVIYVKSIEDTFGYLKSILLSYLD